MAKLPPGLIPLPSPQPDGQRPGGLPPGLIPLPAGAQELQGPPLPEGFTYEPDAIDSAGRGAAQGATAGFADELEGAAKSLGIDPAKLVMSLLAGPAGPSIYSSLAATQKLATSPETIPQDYTTARDEARSKYNSAEQRNPEAYLGGEVAGGIASAAIPGAAPAKGIASALKVGVATGALSGLGSSEADITKGDVAGAAKDTAIGGAAGGALSGALYGAGRGIDAVARRIIGGKGAAKSVAREVANRADELEAASDNGSRGSFFATSMDLERDVAETTGERLNLRPGQSTGDPELALAEMKANNFPATMTRAQQLENEQLRVAAKYLDSMTDKVSGDPALLGKEGVGQQLADSVDRYVDKLRTTRNNKARPLYDRFQELAGNVKLPTSNTTALIEKEIAEMGEGAGKEASAKLAQSLKVLKEGDSLQDIAAERKFWSAASASTGTTLDQLGDANKRRIARGILQAIDADMANAERLGTGEAWKVLKKANSTWAKYSKPIDEAATDTVRRILKVSTGDATDTITAKIMSSSPQQIAGVFHVLNKADPDTARVVRAQLLDDILTKSGKPMRPVQSAAGERVESIAAQEGVSRLRPGSALAALRSADNEARLLAAFAGDDKALFALRRSFQLLKRLSFGPGIKGSNTASQAAQAMAEAGDEVVDRLASAATGGGPLGTVVGKAGRFVLGILGNDKALNEVYSSGANIQLFNQALEAQLSGRAIKAPTLNALAAIANVAGLNAGNMTKDDAQ